GCHSVSLRQKHVSRSSMERRKASTTAIRRSRCGEQQEVVLFCWQKSSAPVTAFDNGYRALIPKQKITPLSGTTKKSCRRDLALSYNLDTTWHLVKLVLGCPLRTSSRTWKTQLQRVCLT